MLLALPELHKALAAAVPVGIMTIAHTIQFNDSISLTDINYAQVNVPA